MNQLSQYFVFICLLLGSFSWSQAQTASAPSDCQVSISGQTHTVAIKEFFDIVASTAKTNSCVYAKVSGVSNTGVVFRGGVKIGSSLSNTQAKKLIAGDESYCLQLSCDPKKSEPPQPVEPQIPALHKNENVIDIATNQLGVVNEVFADGRATVLFHDDTSKLYVRSYPTQLAKEVESVGQYRSGGRVVDYSGETGTIRHIFNNGIAFVDYPSDTSRPYIRKIESEIKLAPFSVPEYQGFVVGSRIIDNGDNSVGSVIEIYSNGQFKLLFEADTSRYYYRTVDQIRLVPNEVTSLNGITIGDTVIDNEDNSVGVVKFIFTNGIYRILFSVDTSRYYDRRIDQITPAVRD